MWRARATDTLFSPSYLLRTGTTNKVNDMNAIALSTIVFQGLATVALVLGVAVGAILSLHRTHG